MNDHDLDLALRTIGGRRTQVSVPPSLRVHVHAVSSGASRHGGFLPHITWRFLEMSSATKFVVGGVIAALIGTVYLASTVTSPAPSVPGAAPSSSPAPVIHWTAPMVDLSADAFSIEANDLVFTTEGIEPQVHSDPGGPDYWTLEVEWTEQDLEQRLYLYFGSDGTDWWVDEIRTRDGYDPAEWIYAYGPFFKTPLGETYEGDVEIDLVGEGRPGDDRNRVPGVLAISGMTLAVSPRSLERLYAAPPDGGMVAETDPFEPEQPLHCSGILQLDPATAHQRILDAGYRVSYRLMHPSKPAEVLLVPPDGTIESSALGSYGEIVVFVNDPSLGAAPQATWPPDCANAPSPAPLGAMDPAPLTGTLDDTDWYGAPTVTYGDPMQLQEDVTLRMTWDASDPRITGDVTYAGTWHMFPRAYLTLDAATIVVTNDGGRWVGTGTGLQMDGEHAAPFTAVLAGEGAYSGLTAYVVLDWMGSTLQGAIFPGPMPEAPSEA